MNNQFVQFSFFRFIFAVLAVFMLSAGCAEQKFQETTTLEKFKEIHKQQEQDTDRGSVPVFSPATLAGDTTADYLLGPGDLITVKVFETRDLDTEVRVSSRGFVSLPLLDNVQVFNLTAAEAEEKIEKLYREQYLHNPHVTVYIKEHVSRQITLVGAVGNPGAYDYVTRKRLLDVLAIGNGLSNEAGSTAFLTRVDPVNGKSINYLIDLDELVKRGNMEQNIVVLGGDVIFVPESGQCFIDGAVRKPGTYRLETKMTVTEGIALAGGLAPYADDDAIKLIRYMGKGRQREIISLNYSDLQAGVGDTLFLQDQDIIFAESSVTGTLFSGTGFSIGFLGTGINYKNPNAR